MKKVLCIVMAMLLLCSCSAGVNTSFTSGETPVPTPTPAPTDNAVKENVKMENTNIKITMDNGGEIYLELYPEYAPETVANFVSLVKDGFYNGLTFHRIIRGFMIQGGDPEGTGFGGSDKTIKGEFASNGFAQNTLSHERGVISMARSQMPNSASSQFFIVHEDSTFLDGDYAAFGVVTEGMDTVDEIANVATGYNDKPITPVVIEKMEIID